LLVDRQQVDRYKPKSSFSGGSLKESFGDKMSLFYVRIVGDFGSCLTQMLGARSYVRILRAAEMSRPTAYLFFPMPGESLIEKQQCNE
jgi:hypothetical protein